MSARSQRSVEQKLDLMTRCMKSRARQKKADNLHYVLSFRDGFFCGSSSSFSAPPLSSELHVVGIEVIDVDDAARHQYTVMVVDKRQEFLKMSADSELMCILIDLDLLGITEDEAIEKYMKFMSFPSFEEIELMLAISGDSDF